jgi:hypothetical protein
VRTINDYKILAKGKCVYMEEDRRWDNNIKMHVDSPGSSGHTFFARASAKLKSLKKAMPCRASKLRRRDRGSGSSSRCRRPFAAGLKLQSTGNEPGIFWSETEIPTAANGNCTDGEWRHLQNEGETSCDHLEE